MFWHEVLTCACVVFSQFQHLDAELHLAGLGLSNFVVSAALLR